MITKILSKTCLAFVLLISLNVKAAPIGSFTVNSVSNGLFTSLCEVTCSPLDTGVLVNIGDSVTISTLVNDVWNINGFVVNAYGFSSNINFGGGFNFFNEFTGPGAPYSTSAPIQFGALAYSIGGNIWSAAASSVTNTSITFVSAISGNLFLAMWDTVTSDNNRANSDENNITALIDLTPATTSSEEPLNAPSTILMFLGVLAMCFAKLRARR